MTKNNFPIYLSLATIFGVLIGVFMNGNNSKFSLSSNTQNEAKIRRLMDYIDQNYVDTINTSNLLDEAISDMLGKLDPHSAYIPKENLQDIQERMQGKFVGIGIQFRIINDSVTVVEPIKGGPSIKAGIKAGDRILIADKDTLSGKKLNSNEIPRFLKGASGTDVNLQVYRKTNDSLFNLMYVIKEAKNPINGIIVTRSLGMIKIVRLINIFKGKPFITIRSINLRD